MFGNIPLIYTVMILLGSRSLCWTLHMCALSICRLVYGMLYVLRNISTVLHLWRPKVTQLYKLNFLMVVWNVNCVVIYIADADDLATQGTRSSTVIILTQFPLVPHICVSESGKPIRQQAIIFTKFKFKFKFEKMVYCHKYINIHNIHKHIYSDNEGNEADAYLPLYGEWDQLINSVMAYSL